MRFLEPVNDDNVVEMLPDWLTDEQRRLAITYIDNVDCTCDFGSDECWFYMTAHERLARVLEWIQREGATA